MKGSRVLAVMLALIMALSLVPVTLASAQMTPGTYTASAMGYGGQVTATVTVDDSGITAVEISGEQETPAIGGAALEQLAANALAQGAEMDGVTQARGRWPVDGGGLWVAC